MLTSARIKWLTPFLTPVFILGFSQRHWPYALAITFCFYFATWLLLPKSRASTHWFNLFLFVAAIEILLRMFSTQTLGEYGFQKGVYIVLIVLPFSYCFAKLISNTDDFRPLLWGYIILSVASTAYLLLTGERSAFGQGRYNWQGNTAAIAGVAAVQMWVIPNRPISIIVTVLASIGVLLSGSRQGFIILVLGIGYIVAANLIVLRRFVRLTAICVLLFAVYASSSSILSLPMFETFKKRFAALQTSSGITFLDRGQFYGYAWQGFLASPVIGAGVGEYQGLTNGESAEGYYPHNVILEVLAEQGVIGFSLLIAPLLFGAAGVFTIALQSKSPGWIAGLIPFLGAFVKSSISGDLTDVMWWLYGIVCIRMITIRARSVRFPTHESMHSKRFRWHAREWHRVPSGTR